jgi:tetratricopeptide (TPR) repeat protein
MVVPSLFNWLQRMSMIQDGMRSFWLCSFALALSLCSTAGQGQAASSQAGELARHARLAQQYLSAHEPVKAITELRAVVALDPKNLEARANLGVLLFFQGQYGEALPQLRAATEMKPDLWKIQSLLGIAERRTGDDRQGRVDLEAAFPHIEEEKLKVDVGLDLVESYAGTGDLNKASDVIALLLKLRPTDPSLLYTSYRIHSSMMSEALLSLSLVAPESAQMHQAIAHELQRTQDLPGAIKNLRAALALDPRLPGIHFELAEALHASDDQRLHAEAEEQYKMAVESAPNDPKAASRMGDIEAEKGDLVAAETYYRQALKLEPNSMDATIGLANVVAQKGDPAAAATLLEQVIAADPTNYLAHFRLSAVYRRLNRPDDVKRELESYKKYKDMREKLKTIYHQMTVDSPAPDPQK